MHNKSSSNDPTEDTNLVISLFTSALNDTFEKQQATFIERLETTFEKSNKAKELTHLSLHLEVRGIRFSVPSVWIRFQITYM